MTPAVHIALAAAVAAPIYARADVRADSPMVLRADDAVKTAYRFGDKAVEEGRVRWQLCFALGTEEVRATGMEYVDLPDGGYQATPRTEVVTFDRARLSAMVDAYRAFVTRTTERGSARQLLPVSWQHAIEGRMYGEWCGFSLELSDLARAGNIHDLALIESGVPVPGLYALVEWTPRAWGEIQAGTWVDVSPTTAGGLRLIDGTEITAGEGMDVFIALALVDDGALHDIGSARDSLPFDAVPSEVTQRRRELAESTLQTRFGVAAGAQIMRSRNMAGKPTTKRETAPTTNELTPATVSAEPRAEGSPDASAIEAALKPLMDEISGLKERITNLENAAKDETDDVEAEMDACEPKAAAPVMDAVSVDTAASDAAAVNRAKRALEARIDKLTDEAIAAGSLLPASVPAFRAALRKNDTAGAEALLCSVIEVATPTGVVGRAAEPAKAAAQRAVPYAEFEREFRRRNNIAERGAIPSSLSKKLLSETLAARHAGTITD